MRIVGSVLVRNEDVFVEQAIRNAAAFCDEIHAVDHVSSDRTWDILRALAREYDHLSIRRSPHSRASQEALEPYFGTPTWVLRIDGDELYDPLGLRMVRENLAAGEHREVFRVLGNVLHVVELDLGTQVAVGYLSPPSRPISALYNLQAIRSWADSPQRLHGGRPVFRDGYYWQLVTPLYQRYGWDESPLRCVHACFLRRSSADAAGGPRANLGELGAYRRDALGGAERVLRRVVGRPAGDPRLVALRREGSSWKLEKYRRGELVSVDASAFLSSVPAEHVL